MTATCNLKAFREQAKMTQAQLASEVSVAQPTMCQYETGIRNPGLKIAKSIVAALRKRDVDCTIEDCFPG